MKRAFYFHWYLRNLMRTVCEMKSKNSIVAVDSKVYTEN